MNRKLLNKLNSYSVLAGALFTVSNVNSQIQYTDIDPDIDISKQGDSIYVLDMNNDGQPDFSLFRWGTSSYINNQSYFGSLVQNFMMIDMKNASNAFNGKDTIIQTSSSSYTSIEIADVMKSGDTIDQNNNWKFGTVSSSYRLLGGWFINKYIGSTSSYSNEIYVGGWGNSKNKYLGLKFVDNAQTYYGWVRLDVDTLYERMVIKDYAYNTIADSMILAGDTGQIASNQILENDLEDNFTAYSINKSVNIILKEEYKEKTICIYDISGKRIHVSSIQENSVRIPLLHLGNSILIVEVITEKGVLRKKILI